MRWTLAILIFATAMNNASAPRADEIVSGLAVGQHPPPLQVRDCTGPASGKTLCYTCRYAERPTIVIFSREVSPSLAQLAKRIDEQLDQHRDERLAAYVVIIDSDSAELEMSLKLLAKDLHLRHLPLTILRDRASKLVSSYRVTNEATVTVMNWRNGTVAASRGFASSKLSPAEIEHVLSDAEKLLGK